MTDPTDDGLTPWHPESCKCAATYGDEYAHPPHGHRTTADVPDIEVTALCREDHGAGAKIRSQVCILPPPAPGSHGVIRVMIIL